MITQLELHLHRKKRAHRRRGKKNTDLEAKIENGLKQLRGPPEKSNAATMLDYYKPREVDPRNHQPQPPEAARTDGAIVSENRGSHLDPSLDVNLNMVVDRQIFESTAPEPRKP